MQSTTHPFLCDLTVVNDLRAVLFEALSRREAVLSNPSEIMTLHNWDLATRATQRLNRFFTNSIVSDCAFTYPTMLYVCATDCCERTGYHFSAPPVVYMAETEPVVRPQGTTTLHVAKLRLSDAVLSSAGDRLYSEVMDTKAGRKGGMLLKYLNSLYTAEVRQTREADDAYGKWQKCQLISLHTHEVANTIWDSDQQRCTPLQRRVLDTCVKPPAPRADSLHDVLPRGLAYSFAAMEAGKGFCHSTKRDQLLGFFGQRSWTTLIDAVLYSRKQLETRLQQCIVNLLSDYVASGDVDAARYCLLEMPTDTSGKPLLSGIDRDRISGIVDGWEKKAWRLLLREVLCREDLRENRIKTYAYKTMGGIERQLTVMNVVRMLPNWLTGKHP